MRVIYFSHLNDIWKIVTYLVLFFEILDSLFSALSCCLI